MNNTATAIVILIIAFLCFCLSALGDSYRVGNGQKWHVKGTNSLSLCKLPIGPEAKPSTNSPSCKNCIRATK